MFTGIIHQTAIVAELLPGEHGSRLRLHELPAEFHAERGESVAVNGVCLTVVDPDGNAFSADLSPETLSRTTIGNLSSGMRVNIERSLRLSDRLGGHLVQGHVDTIGALVKVRREGQFITYRWSFPLRYGPLVVDKGSIAVDGVSLTAVDPDDSSFSVALIPETLEMTNLGAAAVGDSVNLEFDIMAKFAQRMLTPYMRPGR
ncbi:MAG: riboflavin synthase [Acidobacteriota bacterium]